MEPQAGLGSAADRSPTFGTWLRRERRRLDLTQNELASLSGCALVSLKKIESGQLRPSKSLAGALAKALQIPPEDQASFVHFARAGQPPSMLPAEQRGPDWYTKRWRDTLPIPLAKLIGRDHEVEQIQDLLGGNSGSRTPTRLLTLTGPGGVGKTSLAVQAVKKLREHFRQGIFFVDLSPLTDPQLVVATVVQTIGLKDEGRSRWQDSLINFLYDKHVLLVLDNFEHLLTAAPQVSSWLRACERLQVLVTSREPLHVRGEKQFPLQPLTVPEPSQFSPAAIVAKSAALELLVERLREAKPDFVLSAENALVASELCARLDGLPLAIELAAAQIRHLTLQEILARLERHLPLPASGARDLPDRQRTITSTIAWSYSLLDAEEKILFRQLAVFAGGFNLSAVEAVVSVPGSDGALPNSAILPLLGRLVEKSLLQTDERSGSTRYRFLETIRQFARDQLVESREEAQVAASHLNHFMEWAIQAGAHLRSSTQMEWIRLLNIEMDNLRAAIQWARLSGAFEQGLRLLSSVWIYWLIRGNWSEVKEWVLALLPDRSVSQIDIELRARACFTAGQMAFRLGDRSALSLFDESIACAKEIEPEGMSILALAQTTQIVAKHFMEGDFKQARVVADEAIHSARATGDAGLIGAVLNNLGVILVNHGDYHMATSALEEAMSFWLQTGDQRGIAISSSNLGYAWIKQGNYPASRSYQEKALSIFRELGDPYDQIPTMLMLAEVPLGQGDGAQALELYNECKQLWLDFGLHRGGYLIGLGRVKLLQDNLDEARTLVEEGLQYARQRNKLDALRGLLTLSRLSIKEGKYQEAQALLHEAFNLVRQAGGPEVISEGLELVAAIASAQERPVVAAHLLGAAESLRLSASVPIIPNQHAEHELTIATVRAQLSQEQFAACSREGRGLALEQAMILALENI